MTMQENPKQIYGDNKVPLHLFPFTAIALGSMALLEGREKYGQDNFRASPVEAMTYVRACMGHLMAWAEGRDVDPASGLDELGQTLACIAILIDAKYAGTLVDNRKFPGGFHQLMEELEPHVARLRQLHADKQPAHYTKAGLLAAQSAGKKKRGRPRKPRPDADHTVDVNDMISIDPMPMPMPMPMPVAMDDAA